MRIRKGYVRSIRNELGRYPAWPIQQNLSLGSIGTYDGRNATFDWHGSLTASGIKRTPTHRSAAGLDELYMTLGCVNVSFDCQPSPMPATAKFAFTKQLSIATQGHGVKHVALNLGSLQSALIPKIASQQLDWDMKWVILTELWEATAFTMLVSGGRGGRASLSTGIPVSGASFNIADTQLGITLAQSSRLGYQAVAAAKTTPFFRIHRVVHNKRKSNYSLKPYGRS